MESSIRIDKERIRGVVPTKNNTHKKTVSLSVESGKWSACRAHYNMSGELDRLMDMLLSLVYSDDVSAIERERVALQHQKELLVDQIGVHHGRISGLERQIAGIEKEFRKLAELEVFAVASEQLGKITQKMNVVIVELRFDVNAAWRDDRMRKLVAEREALGKPMNYEDFTNQVVRLKAYTGGMG